MLSDIERIRRLKSEQEDIARTYHLPGLADLEMVKAALPLASIADLPSQDRDDGIQDRGAVMQQRSDAYHLIRYGSILEEDLAEKFVDLTGIDTTDVLANKVSDFWTDCTDEREKFREALNHIVQDKELAREQLTDYLSSAANDFVIVPKLNWPNSRAVDLTYLPLSDKGFLGYVLMVLLENNDVSQRLRKCEFRMCGDFFITHGPPSGGPRVKYCSDSHRLLERKIRNNEYQKTHHDIVKKKQAKKVKPKRARK